MTTPLMTGAREWDYRVVALVRAVDGEKWVPVPGWEGLYEVSNLGRARSLDRLSSDGSRRLRGTVLKASIASHGYPTVTLWRDGSRQTFTVHALVARVFLGECPSGEEVRHLDGDRRNPALGNLAYGSRSQNVLDAVDHGTHFQAAKTHCPTGHEYTTENTYRGPRGRHCRTCAALHKRTFLAARR